MRDQGIPLSKKLSANLQELDKALATDTNFDIIVRKIEFAGREAALIFVDGLVNDNSMIEILRGLARAEKADIRFNTFHKVFHRFIHYTEVKEVDAYEEIVNQVLSGQLAMLIDGEDHAIMIDVRTYPARGPEEPDLEKVVRGSRDGFTETLVFNTALIRRRLRDPKLRIEILTVGTRTKSDIVVCYIEDIANPELVDSVKQKIREVKIDGVTMAEKSLEELITPGSAWNPYPRVRFTERPDVAAAHLLEGHVIVMVDTSPSAIVLPATFFHHLQHAEEFRQNPASGLFIRWVRFFGVFVSIFILPLWLLVSLEPQLLPEPLAFIGPEEVGRVPLFAQFVLAEIAVEMIRLATIHTPSPIATAMGIIAAILIGDIAIQIGLFVPEVILYTAIAAIGTFMTPSQELAMANRLVRLFLLVLVGLFQLPGLVFGVLFVLGYLAATRSFGVPYLWPLIPFNWGAMKTILERPPVAISMHRPSVLKPRDARRRPALGAARKPTAPGDRDRDKGRFRRRRRNSSEKDD
ncbi:MAG: spore germination protein [Desulforudis sp.]|nr:MAG: spore germination protein [Desulforudis sp.]